MPRYLHSWDVIKLIVLCPIGPCSQNMIFLTVVGCEFDRNRYFAGTDESTWSHCQKWITGILSEISISKGLA